MPTAPSKISAHERCIASDRRRRLVWQYLPVGRRKEKGFGLGKTDSDRIVFLTANPKVVVQYRLRFMAQDGEPGEVAEL